MGTTKKNLEASQEIFNATTGGDSFPVVGLGNFPEETDFYVTVHGKYAMRNVNIQIVDSDKFLKGAGPQSHSPSDMMMYARQVFHVESLLPKQQTIISLSKSALPQRNEYNIFLSAPNGFWFESLLMTRLSDMEVVTAIRVSTSEDARVVPVYEAVDKKYPRNEKGEVFGK